MTKVSDKPLRILQIGMHDQIGGVENFLMNYYRNIDRNLIQFDFINMYECLCFSEEIIKLGGKIFNIPNIKRNPLLYFKKLKEVISDNKYDIVHIHMLSAANIVPILAAKDAGVSHIIVHSHCADTPKGIIRKILNKINKKLLLDNATDFFACSIKSGKWLFGSQQSFSVINNAIDVKKYCFNIKKREEIRNLFSLNEKFVIGHIGRMVEEKNHDFLIDVFIKYLKYNSNAVLLLVGKGKRENELKKKIQKLNLTQKVIFIGEVLDVSPYLSAMDLFLFPSKFEGLGMVAIESQCNNLMVIGSSLLPEETKISNKIIYKKLVVDDWVKAIKSEYISRKKKLDLQVDNFDIKIQSKKLESIYLKFNLNK